MNLKFIIQVNLLDVINSNIWIKDKYYGTAGVFDGKCLNIIKWKTKKPRFNYLVQLLDEC